MRHHPWVSLLLICGALLTSTPASADGRDWVPLVTKLNLLLDGKAVKVEFDPMRCTLYRRVTDIGQLQEVIADIPLKEVNVQSGTVKAGTKLHPLHSRSTEAKGYVQMTCRKSKCIMMTVEGTKAGTSWYKWLHYEKKKADQVKSLLDRLKAECPEQKEGNRA